MVAADCNNPKKSFWHFASKLSNDANIEGMLFKFKLVLHLKIEKPTDDRWNRYVNIIYFSFVCDIKTKTKKLLN